MLSIGDMQDFLFLYFAKKKPAEAGSAILDDKV